MPKVEVPTERDRYWLEQSRALAASGKNAKTFAQEQGLSIHAFYQARKRLRKLGLLSAGPARRSPKKKTIGFSKVEVRTLTAPPISGADFRLCLPNGLVFEWSGATLPESVVELLERLIAQR